MWRHVALDEQTRIVRRAHGGDVACRGEGRKKNSTDANREIKFD